MSKISRPPIVQKVLNEVHQSPESRQKLIRDLEAIYPGRKVVTFFTSFNQPAIINDDDANMLEGILQQHESKDKLLLIINSPGGDALAAERIINICRKYSDGSFEVIVPKMAKSAATMICLGAEKIFMSGTSELGPIDPQISLKEDGDWKTFSVYGIVESYKKLLKNAIATKGRMEPFLQQLTHYDPRLIEEMEKAQLLAEDIAVNSLKSGMMKGASNKTIKSRLKPFSDPAKGKAHGRPIYLDFLKKSKFAVQEVDLRSKDWDTILELYVRTNFQLINKYRKIAETRDISYIY